MQEAMADAEFYGARHRQLRVGTMLPIIMAKQIMLVEKQNKLIYRYALSVTLLGLLIVAFIVIIFIQLRKLKAAKYSLSEANSALVQTNTTITETNSALREANRIKDEYIGYYFNINSEYIDKIERFKTSVSQKLEMGRYEDIKKTINKIDLKKEREGLSQGFDKVFIKLFPDFVKEFNSLFNDEDQIELPTGTLLNTELRIFALIRLGIHDNDRIAKILDYSVNTIYSYKTRIKNKSFVPNEEFEDKIMAIKAD
jgi:cell division protein FtsB